MRSWSLLGVCLGANCLLAVGGTWPLTELGNLSASAVLGWCAWHAATRTLPDMLAAFRAELAEQRAHGREERQLFREELAAERQQRQACWDDLAQRQFATRCDMHQPIL